MDFKQFIRQLLFFLGIYLIFGSSPALASHSQILACIKYAKNAEIKICAIKTNLGQKGSNVTIYNHHQYWVASGVVHVKRKGYVIAFINAGVNPIFTHYSAKIDYGGHWDNNFSAIETW